MAKMSVPGAVEAKPGPEYGKKDRLGAVDAKPEVEIWRRPDFLTRRPRLPIRPPMHYGVYLAPLWSFSEIRPNVGQSTHLLPVCPRRFCHAFFGLH